MQTLKSHRAAMRKMQAEEFYIGIPVEDTFHLDWPKIIALGVCLVAEIGFAVWMGWIRL